jgi:hypothetical protein
MVCHQSFQSTYITAPAAEEVAAEAPLAAEDEAPPAGTAAAAPERMQSVEVPALTVTCSE